MQKLSVFRFWDLILGLQLCHPKCSFYQYMKCKLTKQGTWASLVLINIQVLPCNFEQPLDKGMLWLLLSTLFNLMMLNPESG